MRMIFHRKQSFSKQTADGLLLAAFFLFIISYPLFMRLVNTWPVSNSALLEASHAMVNVAAFIPDLKINLRYASNDNLCGEKIYTSDVACLRRGTAEKLRAAQQDLKRQGYELLLWDAYRPPAAQFKLWEKMPDARFLINPHKAYSHHSRGVAVDVTLLDRNGRELVMPSAFDEFSARADRDYSDVNAQAANNAQLLERIMCQNGFLSIYYEWWHFVDSDRSQYDVWEGTGKDDDHDKSAWYSGVRHVFFIIFLHFKILNTIFI